MTTIKLQQKTEVHEWSLVFTPHGPGGTATVHTQPLCYSKVLRDVAQY